MDFEYDGIDGSQARKLFLGLTTLCGFFLAIAAVSGGEPGVSRTIELGDLSEAHIVEIRDAVGRTMLSGEFRTVSDSRGNIERDAALTDPSGTKVIGEVEIEITGPNAPERRQELEIDIIELVPRAMFTVVIDDRAVTTFATDDRGSVDLEIEAAIPD